MITTILSFLKGLGLRDGIIAVLFVSLVVTATQWHKASLEAKNIRTVYSNPEVKTVERVVYREGPVRIHTVTVKQRNGDKVTTRTEERAEVSSMSEANTESKIVPVSVSMTPIRTDRWLLSVGVNRLTPDFDGKAVFVGYGFRNRFDLQVGGLQHDGFSPWVLATMRF